MSDWTWKVVSSFGGGIDYVTHPAFLRDDQWTDSQGWLARRGCAEVGPTWTSSFATLGAVGDATIGLVQDPFTQNGAYIGTVDGVGAGRLFNVSGTGVVTEITATGTAVTGRQFGLMTGGFLNSQLILSFAFSQQTFGLITLAGGANYSRIDAAIDGALTALAFEWIAGFKGRIVGGNGWINTPAAITSSTRRTIAWSDANDPRTWRALISNSADSLTLDDVPSGVTDVLPIGTELLGFMTRQGAQVLAPTGGIPAFTRQELYKGPGTVEFLPSSDRQSFSGLLPYGAVFLAADNLYLLTGGRPEPIGTGIIDYFLQQVRPDYLHGVAGFRPYMWHEELGLMVCPRPGIQGLSDQDVFYFEPESRAWSRMQMPQSLGTGFFRRQAFIYSVNGSQNMQRRHWITTARDVYVEDLTTAVANRTVDTKDFSFGDPPITVEVDRMKIDWEPLTSTADVLQVNAVARNDFLPASTVGDGTRRLLPSFVTQDTLLGGPSEMPVRLRGKFLRFQFQNQSGKQRIRGFSFRWRPVSDRKRPGST